jgi:uncharacterized membrane protein YdjX (TVP38/TMEM64 family)
MTTKKYRQRIEFLILIIALASVAYLGSFLRPDTRVLQASLEKLPLFLSGTLYIILYVIITFFLFFSKDVFWFLGAVLFGASLSTLFIWISELINALILFHLARRFGRAYVKKSLSKKYTHLDRKLGKISFFWLFIFRAAPLIPYRFLDLAAGLTRIRFQRYFLAAALGTPVKMFWIQYILAAVGRNALSNPSFLAKFFLSNRNIFLLSFVYLLMVMLVFLKIQERD